EDDGYRAYQDEASNGAGTTTPDDGPHDDYQEPGEDDEDAERSQVRRFHRPTSTPENSTRTIRTIVRAIAMLVHFESDPNMMGMGPIKITPPPLTLVLLSPLPDDLLAIISERKTTRNPTRMIATPIKTRSGIRSSAVGFLYNVSPCL